MDNFTAHQVAGVAEAVRSAGASLMYLPPYSPDLNPIAQMIAEPKALLRESAAGTHEAQWTTIGKLLDAFSPNECRSYLEKSGYAFE